MLKKLRSRRGFTIVEVMVAFVIFAIFDGAVIHSTYTASFTSCAVANESSVVSAVVDFSVI